MAFADLKNDFVFRRVFGHHPELLRGLLNALLERQGEATLEGVDYLPVARPSLSDGAKFSIVNARCRARSGAPVVVEMQRLHLAGFHPRTLYDVPQATRGTPGSGESCFPHPDVVAISICDFALWPDAA